MSFIDAELSAIASRAGGTATTDTRRKAVCSVPRCGRAKVARGLCQTHRMHQRQGKSLSVPIIQFHRPRPLSRRRIEVLRHMALGEDNHQIGAHLGIGQSCVKAHVSAVMRHLGADTRLEAVLRAQDAGLVPNERAERYRQAAIRLRRALAVALSAKQPASP